MENEALYLRLMAHPDPEVSGEAKRLYASLGELYDVYGLFCSRWRDMASVRADPQAYFDDVQELLT